MKLLVSDYDGTIKSFHKDPSLMDIINLKINVNAIKKFINKGNIFVINTCRNTASIKSATNNYKIPYNYLISYNGAVIHDSNNKLIYQSCIDKKTQDIIKELYETKNIIRKLTIYIKDGKTTSLNDCISVGLKTYNLEEIYNYLYKSTSKLDLKIRKDSYNNYIWIKNNTSKSSGIFQLLNSTNLDIEKNSIYTIGDSSNDLDMINDFNGYFVEHSNINNILYKEANVKNVATLIKKNQITH